jgi:hypothetical protein
MSTATALGVAARLRHGSDASRDAVLDTPPGAPYSEEAFRYLLAIERKRATRSGGTLLLLLVTFKKESPAPGVLDAAVAAKVFEGLRVCIREIDFTGWYRTDRVAGTVLTQGAQAASPEIRRRIGERAVNALAGHVPSRAARRVRVRVLQLCSHRPA